MTTVPSVPRGPRAPRASSLTASRREADLAALASGEVVDVLVIGGGVTGAGVALDAATRGLSVALVEKGDLATGTSRWSSKLAHGGLRYLGRGEVGLAYHSARERHILMTRTAPHLTRALPMLVPSGSGVPRLAARRIGLGARAGDVLRALAGTPRSVLPSPSRLGAGQARLLVPSLKRQGLRGGWLLWEGQLVDDARLVVALARTAAAHGARVVTYAAADAADGRGALVIDRRGGRRLQVRARHVVNATGVWAGELETGVRLRPSRGSHLIVRAERLGDPRAALTVPVPGTWNRVVFALPTGDGLIHIGLTDTPVSGDPVDAPRPGEDEVDFLLSTINLALDVRLEPGDVVGAYAGLRPLWAGASGATADLSRRHHVVEGREGLLTVVGGKLTTYRAMAADVLDRIAARPGVVAGPCRTDRLPLVGAASRTELADIRAPLRLVTRYGTEAPDVAALAADDPSLLQPVVQGASVLGVELAFAAWHEGALTVEDILERRTRLALVAGDAERARPAAESALGAATAPVRG